MKLGHIASFNSRDQQKESNISEEGNLTFWTHFFSVITGVIYDGILNPLKIKPKVQTPYGKLTWGHYIA